MSRFVASKRINLVGLQDLTDLQLDTAKLKFSGYMDLALWDPSEDQDVIEENALNEKSCIQVLKILLTKADTEIIDLEDDVVILQSQLAWADEEWSKICSSALRERIDCLNISIQSLKSNNVQDEHDCGVCLLECREPAERMHEIVKGLLTADSQPIDEQSAVAITKESGSDIMGEATDLLLDKNRLNNSALCTVKKEKVRDFTITPAENHGILNFPLKHPGKEINYAVPVKVSMLDSSRPVAAFRNKKKISTNFISKETTELVATKYGSTPKENGVTQLSCLKPQLKRRNHVGRVKSQKSNLEQTLNSVVQKSSLNAEKHAISHTKEEGKLSNSYSKSSTPSVPISNLSLKPEKNRTVVEGKDKEQLEDTKIKDSNSSSFRQVNGNTTDSERKFFSYFGSKVDKKQGVRSSANDSHKFSRSVLKNVGKEINFPRKFKPANVMVKDSMSEAPKHSASANGMKKLNKLDLEVIDNGEVKECSSAERSKSLESSLEIRGNETDIVETVELADPKTDALKHATEDTNANPKTSKGTAAAAPCKVDPSKSSSKKEQNTVKAPQRVKNRKASLTYTEHAAAGSLLELLNHRREDTTKPHQKKKQRSLLKQVQNAELTAIDEESDSIFLLKLQKKRLKRKRQSNPVSLQEPCLSVEIGLKSIYIEKLKRQCKSEKTDKNASSNQSVNKKTKETKTRSDLCPAEEPSVAPDVSKNSVPEAQQKRKGPSRSPVLEGPKELMGFQFSLAKMDDYTTDCTTDEDWIHESSNDNLIVTQ
ncbi:unnamed protein product [Ilex paraguariensis]|uniref:Uncharacterized protein n=1 Tax=Ilex paraguariensis TaxID=185542 RepID=A0ABC8US31_9AQUA